MRLAFTDVTRVDDIESLEGLAAAGCDVQMQVTGGGSVIDLALIHNAQECMRWLLDRDVPVPDGLKHAAEKTLTLVSELLQRGAVPDAQAAIDAAGAHHLDAAVIIARALEAIEPSAGANLAEQARSAARQADKDARSVEQKHLGSYLTAADYGARAEALRQFAARIK